MKESGLRALTISSLSRSFRDGKLSPLEVTEAYLERIDALDGKINSYITVARKEALAAAGRAERELERGHHRGPLQGIPYAAKDVFATKGIRTTNGSRIFWEHVPDFDATAVRRLNDAGAVMLGKLHLHEFAYRFPNFDLVGVCHNPWDLERTTGGSSSGSAAAVSASLCSASLGTDTSGSVRTPASYCGVVGLKPSIGRVSRFGVTPLSFTLDTVGLLAKTAEDAAILLQELAGRDRLDPKSSRRYVPDYARSLEDGLEGVRVGVPKDYFFDGCDAEVEAAVRSSAKTLEAEGGVLSEVSTSWMPYARAVSRAITLSEASYHHRKLLRERPQDYGPALAAFATGLLVTATQYITACKAREVYIRKMTDLFNKVDVFITPATPTPAPTLAQRFQTSNPKTTLFTGPLNAFESPALSVPCGFTKDGLPIGLQVVGRPFDEATVLRVAHAYEKKAGWNLSPQI